MILQAKTYWPAAISANLWPYAVRAANDGLSVGIPKGKQHTRIELFSGSRVLPKLRNHHTFGCPAYVLKNKLQAGQKINKWDSRARLGINLGQSPKHARSVALILNPTTGLVSPQYHIKFDELFETVRNSVDPAHGAWKVKAKFQTKRVIAKSREDHRKDRDKEQTQPQTTNAEGDHWTTSDEIEQEDKETEVSATETTDHEGEQQESTGNRRSSRRRKQTVRYESYRQTLGLEASREVLDLEPFGREHMDDPIAFAASSDPDTLYYNQAMNQPDRLQFVEAMKKEITDHTSRGHWTIVPRATVPKDCKVLPSVWSMKRKRRVDTGDIYKHKSRLNVHGGKQVKGIDYQETYSPVVQWATIRLVLILGLLYNWYTLQLDYILAFPQADIDITTYMEIPRGIEVEHGNTRDYVLRLEKNLYGRCQAPRVWGLHRDKGLKELGFTQSKIDECMFVKDNTILLVYVDDAIVTGPSKEEIEEIYDQLDSKFDISYEGDITDYLGVHITRTSSQGIQLTQKKLINSIIRDMNLLETTKARDTPIKTTTLLTKGENLNKHAATWKYRSILGKLNFLEKSTRPDLAYAVHNCARFMEDPRENHTTAVMDIARYLLQTRDQGIIMTPTNESFECYVDADFAGLWDAETAEHDRTTARSRSGFIVKFAGCPVIWSSKLQTEIALSTTAAEYVALSMAMREVLPLIELLQELRKFGLIKSINTPKVYCKVSKTTQERSK